MSVGAGSYGFGCSVGILDTKRQGLEFTVGSRRTLVHPNASCSERPESDLGIEFRFYRVFSQTSSRFWFECGLVDPS